MYQHYWNLAHRPFDERLKPSAFFAGAPQRQALVRLFAAVEHRAPAVLLTGKSGVGKSLVASVLRENLVRSGHCVVEVAVTPPSAAEIFGEIAQAMRRQRPSPALPVSPTSESPDDWLDDTAQQLTASNISGRLLVVILDSVDPEGMGSQNFREFAHGLCRLHRMRAGRMTCVLVGPMELVPQIKRQGWLDWCFQSECPLGAMSRADTLAYIAHRLHSVDGAINVFTRESLELVHTLSGGTPRRINRLCDLGLLIGFAEGARQVQQQHIWTAQQETQFLAHVSAAMSPGVPRWRRPGRGATRGTAARVEPVAPAR
jgi:general secretion pathway protein A